ncbi:hypothetical protein Bbelb_271070 [Branchiostoma belcheri]|nr:hypothetical protein Bbelb_271070 [Branchiostoma belcheri]
MAATVACWRIPNIDSRLLTIERQEKETRMNTLEIIRVRVENLENTTVSGAQKHEDLSANSTCTATSVSAELMAEIISTVESRLEESEGQSNGEQESNGTMDEPTAVPIGKYCAGADVLRESAGRCAGLPSGECGTSSGRVRYVLRESAVRPAGECGTFCGSQTFCSSLLEQRKLEVNDLRPACKQDWTGSGCNIKGAGGFC